MFIVAKDCDDVVGVCKGEKADGYNELQAIYVLPDHQGRGIGKDLWNRMALFLGSEKDIVVHVATYNNQAIGFYGKLGFVDTGKRFVKEAHRMPISGVPLPETEMILKGKKIGNHLLDARV